MPRPGLFIATLIAGTSLCSGLTGCITVRSDSLSLDKLAKPKLAKVQTNDDVEETPPDPKHPERLKVAYAQWMEGAGHPEEARKQYELVLKKEPANLEAFLGIARIDHQAGKAQEAEQRYLEAVSLHPDSAAAHYALGRFYVSRKAWNEALRPLKRATELAPEDSDSRYQYAVALAQSGNVRDSLPHFIRTVGDAEAHYNVGLILKDQGQFEEAERHLLIALNKKPELLVARQWIEQLRAQKQGAPGKKTQTVSLTSAETTELVRRDASQEPPPSVFDFPGQLPARTTH